MPLPSIPLDVLVRAVAALKAAKDAEGAMLAPEWLQVAHSFSELDYHVGVRLKMTTVEVSS